MSYDAVQVSVGDEVPEQEIRLHRVDLMRYCGACGDFTGTHWNEKIAKEVGLTNVISHGTLNIATAVRAIADYFGPAMEFMEYSVSNFSTPVVVPDDERGGGFRVSGKVESVEQNMVTIRLYAALPDTGKVMTGVRVHMRICG
ncbi:MaoC/PaaZ C-terminal domain-containing protein [Actinomyces slackii]|uniref:MaoC/PaaZ C-terminal domain-containing protein n=1 Tax=Actinomyces slackii TaxID=52774 RepID=UPI00146FB452|nr:MaoC/PaaZ C-terminal domain-containing protein [Actinomyces slackii]